MGMVMMFTNRGRVLFVFLYLIMDSVSKLGMSRVGKLNVYLAMVCSSI